MSDAGNKPGLVAIASDHGGYELKSHLIGLLRAWGHACEDLGTDGPASVDYPDFANRVALGVAAKRYRFGILVCGTGIGMCISANRHPGVRAALCTSAYMARMARAHNDANVLCLGGRVLGTGESEMVLKEFLDGDFEGGRHTRRLDKIESLAAAGRS